MESERLSIREAAKRLRKGHAYIRQFIDAGKCRAWVNGGSEKHPRLVVDLEELKRALDSENLYVPKGLKRRDIVQGRYRRKAPVKLHPAFAHL